MNQLLSILPSLPDFNESVVFDVAMWMLPVLWIGVLIGGLIVIAILVVLAVKFLQRYK